MYFHQNEARLPECVDVGLHCEDCVNSSATSTAKFCSSLRPDGISVAFLLMYPKPECQSMHSAFHYYYIQAAQPKIGDVLADAA